MAAISNEPISGLSPEFQKAYQVSVQADRKPIEQIEKRKELVSTKQNLLNDLIGRVDAFKQIIPGLNSPFALRELAFNSDDVRVISGSADKSLAEPGKHPIEVLQLAKPASALSNALPDKDQTRLGSGYISFETANGETKEVYIDNDNATLEGIAQAINGSRTGVKASVIMDRSDSENPYKLMIQTQEIGSSADVSFPEFYITGGEEELTIDSQFDATNARVRYQGFEIESPTNEMKDLIPGATINLKGLTDPGKPNTISIEQDIPKTAVKMRDFVDKANEILGFIQKQNTMDANTDTSKTLGGDYGLLLTEEKIRSALRENFMGDETRMIRSLSDIGIQFTKKGTLEFDEKKFSYALESQYDQTVDLMAGDSINYGVITKLSKALNSISQSGSGVLTNERNSMSERIKQMDKQIESKEKLATKRAENLRNSLAKAQAALEKIQGQTGYIQSGGGLPGQG